MEKGRRNAKQIGKKVIRDAERAEGGLVVGGVDSSAELKPKAKIKFVFSNLIILYKW
jgi:hypothetical protein